MITATYFVLVVLAGALTFAGCWIPAALVGALAFCLAWRFELRWLADHTRLTKHAPRPVPPPRHHPFK